MSKTKKNKPKLDFQNIIQTFSKEKHYYLRVHKRTKQDLYVILEYIWYIFKFVSGNVLIDSVRTYQNEDNIVCMLVVKVKAVANAAVKKTMSSNIVTKSLNFLIKISAHLI